MANLRALERAEETAQNRLKTAIAALEKAKKDIDAARSAWMRANKALTEEKIRQGLRREK